jgi:hypothetical protein
VNKSRREQKDFVSISDSEHNFTDQGTRRVGGYEEDEKELRGKRPQRRTRLNARSGGTRVRMT